MIGLILVIVLVLGIILVACDKYVRNKACSSYNVNAYHLQNVEAKPGYIVCCVPYYEENIRFRSKDDCTGVKLP
jgi:hypothetical protein